MEYTPTDADMANAIGDWALRAGRPDSENRPELLVDDGETMLARWLASHDAALQAGAVPTDGEDANAILADVLSRLLNADASYAERINDVLELLNDVRRVNEADAQDVPAPTDQKE
jgi:hypothetical protein